MMKRKMAAFLVSALFVAVAFSVTLTACKSPEESGPPDPAGQMPLMANINVNELKSKPIEAHQDGFEYSFAGNNIALADGVVYGLVAGTTTEVTVTGEQGQTSFSVRVHAALTGTEGQQSAFLLEGEEYVKSGSSYGESLCMLTGEPLNGDGLIASGTLAFGTSVEGAEARIFLRDDAGKDVYLAAEPTRNGYAARGVAGEQTRAVGTYSQTRINFLVFVSEGEAFYYLNDRLVWHTHVKDGVQLGFGGQKAHLTLSRLSVAYNESLVASLKTQARKPFGENMYGVRPNDANSFVDTGAGVYKKTSDGYCQQWLYHDSDPVCGTDYTVKGSVQMLRPAESGVGEIETVWQSCNSAGRLMRVLLRYDREKDAYFIFTDYETPNGFYGSKTVLENVSNTFNFLYEYKDGVTKFSINGDVVLTSNSATIGGVGNLGETHFGFAGQRCHIVLSDLVIEIK